MTSLIRPLVLLTGLLFLTGCATYKIDMKTGDHPLALIKHAVKKSFPNGVRLISENKREYYSNYFLQQRGKTLDAANLERRKYVHAIVYGDSRPYKIVLYVEEEGRNKRKSNVKNVYQHISYDKATAVVIMRRINKILNKSRGKGNIIDDFRIF